jgi:arylsulfatase A-like enzyme
MSRLSFPPAVVRATSALVVVGGLCACSGGKPHAVLAAPILHLADHLDRAVVTTAAAPMTAREQRRWGFADPQADWRPLTTADAPWIAPATLETVQGALRVSVSQPEPQRSLLWIGGLKTDLEPGLLLRDWEAVHIRARSSDRFAGITLSHNLEDEGAVPGDRTFFASTDEAPPLFNDGSEQVYAIPLRRRESEADDVPLRNLALAVAALDPAALDLLSVELVPKGASFLDDYGMRRVARGGETRTSAFAHAPASLAYLVAVPPAGRLDLAFTTTPGDRVTYRVVVSPAAGDERALLDETTERSDAWEQRSVDLSPWAGEAVTIRLEAASDTPGSVALWGAPILSGAQAARRPNVIFYVIDAGGGDLMSLYGYNRRTTPFLEELAAEGVVFDRAFSNATWTQPSTVSFMTSLQHSVLGGLRRGVHSTPVPEGATTMAEHFRAAGYQTASFSANPNAGRMVGLERGVDVMRDSEVESHSTSSRELQDDYWWFRQAYPGEPTWVHIQTTDVHEPNEPTPPFAGLFVSPQERAAVQGWDQRIFEAAGDEFGHTSIMKVYDDGLKRAGVDRQEYFGARRGLYDETMAYQDRQLSRFVERLKGEGAWENTLLIVAADHGHPAGTFARWGRGLFEPQPEPWQGALFDAYATRVPLVFVWPGHIAGGQRFGQAVSMIDVLPTLLDLLDLPPPEVVQGQSLAPLLLGRSEEVRPVILDEFRIDEATGEMIGNLEIVDGRWGASLEIGPPRPGGDPNLGRHAVPVGGRWGKHHPDFPEVPNLLLYDLWSDPFVRHAVNDEHPELVEKYRAVLLEQWQAQRALGARFSSAEDVTLTPAQLQQLRSLGYIQ